MNPNKYIPTLVAFTLLMTHFSMSLAFGDEFSLEESRLILSQVDNLVSYEGKDFSGEYTITDIRPGEGTSRTKMTMFRRDSVVSYTIIIMEPQSDKGKGYLRQGDKLWLYDPIPRRFTVISARDRFQNSNARNTDFTKSTLAEDYRIVGHSTGQLGAYKTDIYDLEAITDDVSFPKMKIWIDQDKLVRKFEDYSLSGRHMRTTAIPKYTRLQESYVPVQIVIQDEVRGRELNGKFEHQRTVISVEKASFMDIPDMVFTQAYIERVSR
ncbi:MAG: outer membrane lipoprotein-sorting protein [Spirochaetia bacterium]|jgi:outer membrane lipoprotein-sorting protein|nr:outer membrane lipoprotein-sorting protein [Spirochaetia bacterium]